MTRLQWDKVGERLYRTGVDRPVLYLQDTSGAYPKGDAWNGVTNITKSPTGGDRTDHYANNNIYVVTTALEKVEGSITAYIYPDNFALCLGKREISKGIYATQQHHQPFGLTYRTYIGNDTQNEEYGYTINIIYGARASAAEEANDTVNDSSDIPTQQFSFSTVPVEVDGYEATSSLEIKSTDWSAAALKKLEDILYGTDEVEARLPLPAEVITILGANS